MILGDVGNNYFMNVQYIFSQWKNHKDILYMIV